MIATHSESSVQRMIEPNRNVEGLCAAAGVGDCRTNRRGLTQVGVFEGRDVIQGGNGRDRPGRVAGKYFRGIPGE